MSCKPSGILRPGICIQSSSVGEWRWGSCRMGRECFVSSCGDLPSWCRCTWCVVTSWRVLCCCLEMVELEWACWRRFPSDWEDWATLFCPETLNLVVHSQNSRLCWARCMQSDCRTTAFPHSKTRTAVGSVPEDSARWSLSGLERLFWRTIV